MYQSKVKKHDQPEKHIGSREIKRIQGVDIKFTEYNNYRALSLEDGALEKKHFNNVVVFRDKNYKAAYYNRAVGMTTESVSEIQDIRSFHHKVNHASTIALTLDQASSPMLTALKEYNYFLSSTNCIFAKECNISPDIKFSSKIRQAEPSDFSKILELWDQQFIDKTSSEVAEKKCSRQWNPNFPMYLLEMDGQVAAMAGMYIADGVAWLGNANTFDKFRKRGCQLELLHYRVQQAAKMGCDLIVSDTEFGTVSHRNLERASFALSYAEFNFTCPIDDYSPKLSL